MKTKRTAIWMMALMAISAFGAPIFVPDALALTSLKQVQVSNGSQVDLLFDGKVTKNQIKTEFINNVIQLSLSGVAVYPAKISTVNNGTLTKIFAYQYAPKLVRCRLSVKGKAQDYRNRFSIHSSANGRMLTVRLGNIVSTAPKPVKSADKADAEEQALLEHVMKGHVTQGNAPHPAPIRMVAKAAVTKPITDRIVEKSAVEAAVPPGDYGENKPLNLGRDATRTLSGVKSSIPSPMGVFGKLALVVGIFALLALAFKKFWKEKAESKGAIFGAIGKFARNNLGVKGIGPKVGIEILANHHLGPKRSIAVVKVGGRTLVVGITEQSINLIAQLSSEEEAMNALVELDNPPLDDSAPISANAAAGATVAGPAVFSSLLRNESAKPSMGAPVADTRMAQSTVNRPAPRSEPRPEARQEARPEFRKDVRVTSYGNNLGVTGNNPGVAANNGVSAQAAMGLSGVRAQIRSKLEGLKQI